jgi:hypothetical protein
LPEGYETPPVAVPARGLYGGATAAPRAVAIVGDVGTHTDSYIEDMDRAVAALSSHGVTVVRFTYGAGSYTWADIVAASQGAHFLLYMGHGVYSGGTCENPDSVGGFYLGPGQFVTPSAIRRDLEGQLAADAVMIFSHVCYSAGSTACDGSGEPDLAEAQRRVAEYAAPFVDLGMQATFANNYYWSAANIIDDVLADSASRETMGDIFLNTYPNSPNNHHDLSYPEAGYDLWLNGTDGAWNNAFVGQPGYVFAGDLRQPALGGVPEGLSFIYSIPEDHATPVTATVTPANVGNGEPLAWMISSAGSWFHVSPTSDSTPVSVQVALVDLSAWPAGAYTGTITVTVTEPADTVDTPQSIALSLRVVDRALEQLYLPLVISQP